MRKRKLRDVKLYALFFIGAYAFHSSDYPQVFDRREDARCYLRSIPKKIRKDFTYKIVELRGRA